MRSLRSLAMAGWIGLGASLLPAAEEFVVVVNQANPVEQMSREELSRLFLKRTPRWPDGRAVVPIDLSASSLVRAAFTKAVHGRPISTIQAFWKQELFSGRSTPPVVAADEGEALERVRSSPDAVTYVAAGTELGAGLKAIQIVP